MNVARAILSPVLRRSVRDHLATIERVLAERIPDSRAALRQALTIVRDAATR